MENIFLLNARIRQKSPKKTNKIFYYRKDIQYFQFQYKFYDYGHFLYQTIIKSCYYLLFCVK